MEGRGGGIIAVGLAVCSVSESVILFRCFVCGRMNNSWSESLMCHVRAYVTCNHACSMHVDDLSDQQQQSPSAKRGLRASSQTQKDGEKKKDQKGTQGSPHDIV